MTSDTVLLIICHLVGPGYQICQETHVSLTADNRNVSPIRQVSSVASVILDRQQIADFTHNSISSGCFENTKPFDIIKLILTIYFADFYFILMNSIFHLHVLKMRQYSHRLHIKYPVIKFSETIVTGGVLSSSSACFSEWPLITLSMTVLLLRLC